MTLFYSWVCKGYANIMQYNEAIHKASILDGANMHAPQKHLYQSRESFLNCEA